MVSSYEPYKLDSDLPGVNSAATVEEAIRDADLLMLLVGHRELKELDPAKLKGLTRAQWAIDTVGGWETQTWEMAGFKFIRLGVGNPNL
jgi:UDP-N-acetyl-D-mannosaminuronate dehydrogenase